MLRVFGDVRPGEAGAALLQLLNLFLLLVGYYVLKTVREPLILATGGAEMKSYAAAAQALVLMGFIPLYSWLAARVSRLQLITWLLALLHRLRRAVQPRAARLAAVPGLRVLRLGRDLQPGHDRPVLVLRQRPLLAERRRAAVPADRHRRERGQPRSAPRSRARCSRLASSRRRCSTSRRRLLLVHLVLYRVVSQRFAATSGERPEAEPLPGPSGFALVLRSRYLRLIAVLLVLLNIVNTLGEYVVSKLVVGAALRGPGEGTPAWTRPPSSAASTAATSSGGTPWRSCCRRFVVSRLVQAARASPA